MTLGTGHTGWRSDIEHRFFVNLAGWREQAACIGSAANFFPEGRESPEAALVVCHGCAVRAQCLNHALALPENYGIFGGVTEAQRGQLRRPMRPQHKAKERTLPLGPLVARIGEFVGPWRSTWAGSETLLIKRNDHDLPVNVDEVCALITQIGEDARAITIPAGDWRIVLASSATVTVKRA